MVFSYFPYFRSSKFFQFFKTKIFKVFRTMKKFALVYQISPFCLRVGNKFDFLGSAFWKSCKTWKVAWSKFWKVPLKWESADFFISLRHLADAVRTTFCHRRPLNGKNQSLDFQNKNWKIHENRNFFKKIEISTALSEESTPIGLVILRPG